MKVLKLIVATVFSAQFALGATPTLGRFVGVFHHDKIARDQLAKLDFITSREENNTLYLKAVLTLHFGDFDSGEYVTYHFDDVRYNLFTDKFIFDQADQPVTVVGERTKANEFVGEFRSAFSGEKGKLFLSGNGAVKPTFPLIESIWGEYRGLCKSKDGLNKVETSLQIHTYRATKATVQMGNPFGAYKVKGFLGEKSGKTCLSGKAEYCVWGNISNASYNFFDNRLFMYSNYKNISCVPGANGLACNDCDLLKRVSIETQEPRSLSPLQSPSAYQITKPEGTSAIPSAPSDLQGNYRGYLHHEYLNVYQPVQLNILTYQEPSGGGSQLQMSAVGSLYFGDFDSSEVVSYRFSKRTYPLLSPQFVFDNAEQSSDAVVQIKVLGGGKVQGIWFSKIFGRVGVFELVKENAPKLPAGAKEMESVSGRYKGSEWELEILASLGTEDPKTPNPFSPLTFEGWTQMPGLTGQTAITGGSYDFYTGRLGLEVGEKIVHLGERTSRKEIGFRKMYQGVMSPLGNFKLEPHVLTTTMEDL